LDMNHWALRGAGFFSSLNPKVQIGKSMTIRIN